LAKKLESWEMSAREFRTSRAGVRKIAREFRGSDPGMVELAMLMDKLLVDWFDPKRLTRLEAARRRPAAGRGKTKRRRL